MRMFGFKKKAKPAEGETDAAETEKPAEAPAQEGDAAPEGAEGAAPPKKSKKKLIIIAVAAIVLIAAGVGGAFFAGLIGGSTEHAELAEGEIGPDGKPVLTAVFYTLPDFLVNLNTGGKQTSFLKAVIVLEVQKSSDIPTIEANLPRLMDGYNTYLRELRASDLSGSAGVQRLREELLLRGNKALAPVKINDVLFKSIVVQ